MIPNYFKVALRNLARHRLYTLINVFGLAIGIAFSILIILFVQQEFSYDSFQRNKDRIFRVMTVSKKPNNEVQVDAFQPMPLIPTLKTEYSDVRYGVRFSTGSSIVKYGDKVFSETLMFTDPDVFSMFTFHFVSGSPASALSTPDAIVLNETMARKYFGDEGALGKRLAVNVRGTMHDLAVTGVIRDLPDNSSVRLSMIVPITLHSMYERGKDRWTTANGSAFIQLAGTVSATALEERFPPFVRKYFGKSIESNLKLGQLSKDTDAYRLVLQPLTDVHLDTKSRWSPEERSDPAYSYILAGIGMFVLMIACINFMTLAIGRSAGRAREVGVRKVLGAVRTQLMKQFWGEALLLCFIALLLGIVFAEVALPGFNTLTHKHLSFHLVSDGWLVAALSGLLVLVGLVAGSYPAAFLSRFEPVEVLKGKVRMATRTTLTKSLIVLQFGLSIILIVGSLVMSEQLRFLLNKDLGYDAEQVVVLQLYSGPPPSNTDVLVDRLRARLASNPRVVSVSGTNGAFTQGYDINSFRHNGVDRSAYVYRVDEYYLETLRIPLMEGRNFDPRAGGEKKGAVIVNEALVKEFGWKEPAVGTRLEGWNEKEVPGGPVAIGVVKDFNFSSLREDVQPAILFLDPDWPMDQALVRISPDHMPATLEQVRTAWNEIAPDKPFSATFLDDDVQRQYEREQKWMVILRASSLMAIALACLGLFGLATLTVTNRTKEIGIRKVLGASAPGIAALLSREFALLVLAANVLAWPVAYYATTRWLSSFAYRIDLGPSVFVLAGGGALVVALATISFQAVKAALGNPVDALRYE